MIPFSPPKIYPEIIAEVVDTLNSGWITTGPKTKQLERDLAKYVNGPKVICLNSATIGMELLLRWFGVKEGDEVIIPSYTYCATGNIVLHCGATPVIVDINDDFNISLEEIKSKITSKTKVIIPVDIGGFPCDYDELNSLIRSKKIKNLFHADTEEQKNLGRILLMADAAHSLGASYNGKKVGTAADATVFSFHAVKNLTTAEGGGAVLNLPKPFDNDNIYKTLNVKSLHGQSKDALAKTVGTWRYDVTEPGYKGNMTDILASMGLVELKYYDSETLPRRKEIFDQYINAFQNETWAEIPKFQTEKKLSSYHLFMLRIKNISEDQRDAIIEEIFKQSVSVNVHFQPLPMLSLYKGLGYKMANYPVAYNNYSREISLPVYYDLDKDKVKKVINAVRNAVKLILGC
jgi:dTDP-4-amino-4,6-dideoxygalactose transaminase